MDTDPGRRIRSTGFHRRCGSNEGLGRRSDPMVGRGDRTTNRTLMAGGHEERHGRSNNTTDVGGLTQISPKKPGQSSPTPTSTPSKSRSPPGAVPSIQVYQRGKKRDAFASSFWRASVSWRANTPSLLKSRSPLDSKDCPGPRTMSCSAILSVAGFSLHARGSRWGRSMNWAILAQSSAWLPIDAQRSSHRIALPS